MKPLSIDNDKVLAYKTFDNFIIIITGYKTYRISLTEINKYGTIIWQTK